MALLPVLVLLTLPPCSSGPATLAGCGDGTDFREQSGTVANAERLRALSVSTTAGVPKERDTGWEDLCGDPFSFPRDLVRFPNPLNDVAEDMVLVTDEEDEEDGVESEAERDGEGDGDGERSRGSSLRPPTRLLFRPYVFIAGDCLLSRFLATV